MTSSPGSSFGLEDTLKAILPEGKFAGPLPPVHLWNPEGCGDIGMEIRADGSWWHEGGRIHRERLVKLFSRILRKDEDGVTYLVTPHEKVLVHVEDAPFLAVRVDRTGEPGPDQQLTFTTNLDYQTTAGPDAPIRIETDPETGAPAPYVLVRGRLEAKLTRPVFYELAELAVPAPDGTNRLGVWSRGVFFPLGPMA
ncbi:MAG: DUF1285 domain-containing protein [Hyphomonas sp.]|uniref:DUF1285 domain-containing protein n=1 Tax=Hyphomonas sp. TaxID=87 RepID=UPI00180DDA79|nr:DUF1285 domain-containing protein [Hyphomonas sp.]MBU3919278.1 DUF1285 domain-containing protein [Alphaproteobacteria bacterium]MBA3068481.1 DUF1285 domain-containing protein [Hyphomonas sp.]MBU4060652.1 DUF1285 domain-containing protein [Alphaproteobacteria bacterium]MBU4164636.1 DUF1285 domain-containing protein [Alphaproteobacteria bacterium]MBU4567896.1 DUF1285 domain-containing protein [Alphaproteobacteria bacterium]